MMRSRIADLATTVPQKPGDQVVIGWEGDDEGPGRIRRDFFSQFRAMTDGDVFRFSTVDRQSYPLPAPELLVLRWDVADDEVGGGGYGVWG